MTAVNESGGPYGLALAGASPGFWSDSSTPRFIRRRSIAAGYVVRNGPNGVGAENSSNEFSSPRKIWAYRMGGFPWKNFFRPLIFQLFNFIHGENDLALSSNTKGKTLLDVFVDVPSPLAMLVGMTRTALKRKILVKSFPVFVKLGPIAGVDLPWFLFRRLFFKLFNFIHAKNLSAEL